MLEIQQLYKSFDDKVIINDLNLKIPKGQRCTIIGPSGSGKSTILKLIVGLIQPNRGSILVDNVDVTTLSKRDLNLVRRKMGLVFQSAALFDSMTVSENIAYPLNEQYLGLSNSRVLRKVKDV